MPEFALVTSDDALLRVQTHDQRPADPSGKGWRWLPVARRGGSGGSFIEGDAWIIETAPPVLAVPQSVAPRQARLALLGAGLLDQVEAAIAAGPRADQITWEFAVDVRRDYALIANLGAALGLTSAQIDDLFRTAATL